MQRAACVYLRMCCFYPACPLRLQSSNADRSRTQPSPACTSQRLVSSPLTLALLCRSLLQRSASHNEQRRSCSCACCGRACHVRRSSDTSRRRIVQQWSRVGGHHRATALRPHERSVASGPAAAPPILLAEGVDVGAGNRRPKDGLGHARAQEHGQSRRAVPGGGEGQRAMWRSAAWGAVVRRPHTVSVCVWLH